MKKQEIKDFLKPLSKHELKTVIDIAEEQLNSSLGIGDSVELIIEYMIGDADGDTEESCNIELETQDDLDALIIIQDILDVHTEPNEGRWGFILDHENFRQKPDDVYNILYNQKKAPKTYNEIKLNAKILGKITYIVSECFRGEAEYSFLVYQAYRLEQ